MFSSITGILKVYHISTSYEPKKILYLPSAQIIKVVVEFVIQEIGGDEVDQLANLHFHFTSVPRCTPMTD